MKKRNLILYFISIIIVAACGPASTGSRPSAPSVAAPSTQPTEATPAVDGATEDVGTAEELEPETMAADSNRLFEQLRSNTPIQVADANASARTVTLTMPTLF